jgi:deoxyuridine 5'-triphosphate nucleotidohydrolase
MRSPLAPPHPPSWLRLGPQSLHRTRTAAPRSGLAWKHFIDTGAGVIDADYRGEVKVLLFNHEDSDFAVKQGDRVAQLIIERIATPEIVVTDDLDASERGAGGFGSTGGFGAAAADGSGKTSPEPSA